MKYFLVMICVLFSACSHLSTQVEPDSHKATNASQHALQRDKNNCLPERRVPNMTEGVVGPRSLESILEGFADKAFIALLNTQSDNDPCFSGELLVKAIIDQAGSVQSLNLLASTFENAKLEKKILQKIRETDYGYVSSEKVTVAYIPIIWKRRQ